MIQQKIQIVYGEDWEGLYLDGKLVCENHSLSHQDILLALGIKVEYLEINQEYLEYLGGRLPSNFKYISGDQLT